MSDIKPVAILHDDGHWTWKNAATPEEKYRSQFAGWRMDVFNSSAIEALVAERDMYESAAAKALDERDRLREELAAAMDVVNELVYLKRIRQSGFCRDGIFDMDLQDEYADRKPQAWEKAFRLADATAQEKERRDDN